MCLVTVVTWTTCCSPYVLYHQGLVPPHIAAGINLNFWPAGPIFSAARALSLFAAPLRATSSTPRYFANILASCSAVVIRWNTFVEGGRSRTGRLLDPKNRHPVDDYPGDAARR